MIVLEITASFSHRPLFQPWFHLGGSSYSISVGFFVKRYCALFFCCGCTLMNDVGGRSSFLLFDSWTTLLKVYNNGWHGISEYQQSMLSLLVLHIEHTPLNSMNPDGEEDLLRTLSLSLCVSFGITQLGFTSTTDHHMLSHLPLRSLVSISMRRVSISRSQCLLDRPSLPFDFSLCMYAR